MPSRVNHNTRAQLGKAAMVESRVRARAEQAYFMPLRTRCCVPSHNKNEVMSLLGGHKAQEADRTGFLGTRKSSCLLTRPVALPGLPRAWPSSLCLQIP